MGGGGGGDGNVVTATRSPEVFVHILGFQVRFVDCVELLEAAGVRHEYRSLFGELGVAEDLSPVACPSEGWGVPEMSVLGADQEYMVYVLVAGAAVARWPCGNFGPGLRVGHVLEEYIQSDLAGAHLCQDAAQRLCNVAMQGEVAFRGLGSDPSKRLAMLGFAPGRFPILCSPCRQLLLDVG